MKHTLSSVMATMARLNLSDDQWDSIPADIQLILRREKAPVTHTKATRVMKIVAKCSDMFNASLHINGKLAGEYDGYVPDFMPGKHYGDYVQLEIDVDTGMIVNWHTPTIFDLNTVFVPKHANTVQPKGGPSYSTFAQGQ